MIATCPSRAEITEFLLGRLPPQAVDEIAEHLDECAGCQAVADSLESLSDTLVERLREPAAETWEPADEVLAQLLDSAAQLPHEPGQRQIRDYRLLDLIGQGGMGVVYRAHHERLGRDVALKLLSPERSGQPQAEARFEREMRAIGQLQHPHIVAALDAGVEDGTYYLAMELVDGCDVSQLLARPGLLPIAEACEIVRQAALGLGAAHERGILHRDVKPSNLLITRAGEVKVADLGLALFCRNEAVDRERTSPSQVQGTLDYLAPEQALGAAASEQSDLYSLGVTFFKLLTGRGPFKVATNASPLQVLLAQRDQTPPALRTLRADVPPALEALVCRLVHSRPTERPAAASAVAAELQPFCSGANLAALVQASSAAIELPAAPLVSETRAVGRTKSWLRPLAAVAALLLLAGAILAALQGRRDDDEAAAPAAKSAAAATSERQQQLAEKLGIKVQQKNSLGMELTLIPAGEFTMGSAAAEVERAIKIEQRELPEGWPIHYFIRKVQVEVPEHKVKLTRPFLMGTHEVTVAQWDAFAKESGYRRTAERDAERYGDQGFGRDGKMPEDAAPMTYVTWDDARAFCNWLSTKEERNYRLPTEAEWEYACRAGTSTRWFSGDEVESLRDYAWTLQSCGQVRGEKHNSADVRPQPVGGKKPNPFGLYDMTGNAWEWCRDHFHQEYYSYSPAEDPQGPKMTAEKQFPGTVVLRGGGNGFRENECRSASRWFLKPYTVESYLGFRVVCEVK